ncbi:MAG: DNA ligase [Oleibacter sp.]|nr:DNA ligase [Thalassolituus sp.]
MSVWMPILVLLILVGSAFPLWVVAAETTPALMLAEKYQGHEQLSQYWASEKYDGVRAFWDGTQLQTRSGYLIDAPPWFLAEIPDDALDGELWLDYGRFDEISALIRSHNRQDDPLWRDVRFMVFDRPDSDLPFIDRYQQLRQLINTTDTDPVQLVKQFPVSDKDDLNERLEPILARGGEGLMLHRLSSIYTPGRSHDLLKVTPLDDDEGIVVGYEEGEGRLANMVGSLRVKLENGRILRIGSGLSDEERQNPPEIGSRIRFTYRGLTATGLPRFATYDRPRPLE